MTPLDVLNFWFIELKPKDWYIRNDDVDATIRARFGAAWEEVRSGGFRDWLDQAETALAYVLLTDQMPRNLWRGDGRSFATDGLARDAARGMIKAGFDLATPLERREFVYMPLSHSEDLADQDMAVQMFSERMESDDRPVHALAHRQIIADYGRFPFRNEALCRASTPEEVTFLERGGYGPVVEAIKAQA